MYSSEERMRAVELYIKPGKRSGEPPSVSWGIQRRTP